MKNPRAQTWSPTLILTVLQIIGTGLASNFQIKANIGENVTLPCVFPAVQGLPLTDIRVFWQTSSDDVLMYLDSGTVKRIHKTDRYSNRTHFFGEYLSRGNFSLLLARVVARDEEEVIHCYIQVKDNTGFSMRYSSGVQLEVSGTYSTTDKEKPALWIIAWGVLGLALLMAVSGIVIFVILKSRRTSSSDSANVPADRSTSDRSTELAPLTQK